MDIPWVETLGNFRRLLLLIKLNAFVLIDFNTKPVVNSSSVNFRFLLELSIVSALFKRVIMSSEVRSVCVSTLRYFGAIPIALSTIFFCCSFMPDSDPDLASKEGTAVGLRTYNITNYCRN